MIKRLPLFPLCALVALAAHTEEEINESAAAEADGHVEVVNTSGSIEVSGWDKNEIVITGTLGDGVKRLDFERDGSDTFIRVVLPKGLRHVESSYLFIKIPEGSTLDAEGVSADIKVSGVMGEQELETVSGDIETQVGNQETDVQAVSGDLKISGNGGSLDLKVDTVSGEIEVSGVGGEVRAETVSGDITLDTETLSQLKVETVNGDIDWVGDLASGGHIDAETVNGNVTLRFDDASHLDVDVESFNGNIKTCLGYESTRKNKYGPGNSLEFEQGDADRNVRVNVLNGRVDICGD